MKNELHLISSSCSFPLLLLIVLHVHVTASDIPPAIASFTFPTDVYPGTPILPSTTVNGVDESDIRFYKDGLLVAVGRFTRRATVADAGTYWITANNSVGAVISKKTRLNVYYLNPWNDTSDTVPLQAAQGDSKILKLPALQSYPMPGHPTVNTAWFQNDSSDPANPIITKIKPDSHYHISINGDLIILDLQTSHAFSYHARFQNPHVNDEYISSKSFQLVVSGSGNSAPAFALPLPDVTFVEKGKTFMLECVPNASPISDLSITWYRQPATGGSRQLLTGSYLNDRRISIISYNDGDAFECEAQVPGGEPITSRTTVSVIESPSFGSRMQSTYEEDLGKKLNLPCSADGNPTPSVEWYKNAIPITKDSDRILIHPNGTISLLDLQLLDGGVYQCVISNRKDSTSDQTLVKLNSSPPVISETSGNVTALENADVMLNCKVDGRPSPTITWSFKSSIDGTSKESLSQQAAVQISRVTWLDTGAYKCTAANTLGSAVGTVHLTVYNRTVITTKVTDYPTEEERGAAKDRSCLLKKDSRINAQILWYQDGTLIANSVHRLLLNNNQTLRFNSLDTLRDQGIFSCQVTSAAGNGTRSYRIAVIEVPRGPEVNASLVSMQRAINVTWKPPYDGNKPILHYNIRSRVQGGSWKNLTRNIEATSRHYLATNLLPSKSYQFVVTAVNSLGEGQWSTETPSIKIPEEPPSEPPVVFEPDTLSSTSVEVKWTPPAKDSWNGELIGYKIKYMLRRDAPNPQISELRVQSQEQVLYSYQLINLSPFTEYWTAVAAFNVKGVGKYSALKKVKTDEGKPQSPPIIRSTDSISSTECRLIWVGPPSETINGLTKGYYIKAYEGGNIAPTVDLSVGHNSGVDLQQRVLPGLKKYTYYRIAITLYTDGGESPAASANCTTQQDKPEKVSNISVIEWTHNSITVGWKEPLITNGIITKYRVAVEGLNNKVYDNIDGDVYVQKISGLQANTAYTILVEAATVKGYGPQRKFTQSTRPPPVAPDPPSNLTAVDIKARSVVILFIPGKDGQAPVTNWLVETTPSKPTQSSNWKVLTNWTDPTSSFPGVRKELKVQLLEPFTQYYFRLIAQNIAGLSSPSGSTEAKTLHAVPDRPPSNISIRAQNSTALIVNWEPLQLDEFNGDSPGYRVEYLSQYRSDKQIKNVTNPLSRFLILGGLTPYTNYTVSIRSFNRLYVGNISQSVKSLTVESTPSQAPAFKKATAVSPTQIDLSWDDLPQRVINGVLLGYKIRYTPANEPNAEVLVAETLGSKLNLTNLSPFTQYKIQVLAYTRIGDGVASGVSTVKTLAGPSSSPMALSMQNIQESSILVTWQPPQFPNALGDINYFLRYFGLFTDTQATDLNGISSTSYYVSGLLPNTIYRFQLRAVNSVGQSETISADVKTTPLSSQSPPATPQLVRITSRLSYSITLSWLNENNTNLPIRNTTIWIKEYGGGYYQKLDSYIPGFLDTYTVDNLKPDTQYSFKLKAYNDVGPSSETLEVTERTSADVPSRPPTELEVIPKSPGSLNLTWLLAPKNYWNGALTHTRVWYTEYSPTARKLLQEFDYKDVPYPDETTMLNELTRKETYEIRLSSVNSAGNSIASDPYIIYVGVAVPIGSPRSVVSTQKSATQAVVTWQPLQENEINGQLLGYKVYYEVVRRLGRYKRATNTMQIDLVGPGATSHTLKNLKIFTEYRIYVTAYNIAGEGPPSSIVFATTDQGLSGPPASLTVAELTLSHANVSWDIPAEPNGNITGYVIQHYLFDEPRGVVSLQHHVTSPSTHEVVKLSRNTTYNVSVQAITEKGEGEPAYITYTTGPHSGVPKAPKQAEYSVEDDGILVKWEKGLDGNSAIQGFVIEGLTSEWEFVINKADGSSDKTLLGTKDFPAIKSFSKFKVSLFNKYGVGESREAKEAILFYRTWWFLVIIALIALLIIISILAVLCCYCFRMRAKMAEMAYEQDVMGIDDETYEMRQSFKRESTRGSRYRAEPPRPSPGAVLYSTEDIPPHYDDAASSVTEKGELSSDDNDDDDDTKTKLSGTDSSDDDIDKTGASSVTPSYNNYQYGGYNHYVSSGAVQQSWQNSFRARNGRNMYTYTDSEAESTVGPSTSHYSRSPGYLHGNHSNSRQLLASPGAPGSRAPLQNFSSFV